MTHDVVAHLASILDNLGAEYERVVDTPELLLVAVPGVAKQKTIVQLKVGHRQMRIQAFLCRRPDERHAQVYDYLLRRNFRGGPVSFSIDNAGDIYLTGTLAVSAISEDTVDELLGAVATQADETFNHLLATGFAAAIRREWAWRERTGESLRNLAAFESWASQPPDSAPGSGNP